MRHLHLLLMAFFFMFAVQGHAAKNTKKTIKPRSSVSAGDDEMTLNMKRMKNKKSAQGRSDKTTSYQIYTAPPKANTGDTSCPHKNAAFSPFSREGKLTQAKRTSPVTAENLRATAIN